MCIYEVQGVGDSKRAMELEVTNSVTKLPTTTTTDNAGDINRTHGFIE